MSESELFGHRVPPLVVGCRYACDAGPDRWKFYESGRSQDGADHAALAQRGREPRPRRSSGTTRVTMPARSSFPSSAHWASRGKSSCGRWSPPCETRIRVRFAKSRGRSIARRLACRREADQHERAAGREQRQTLRERRRAADDVEDEVDRPRLGVRRAELQGLLEPSPGRGRSRGSPPRRRCRAPWIDREPDGAAADHRDASALADPRRLEHRHHARRDGAADQARLLDGQRARDLHRGGCGDDGVRRERPRAQHGRERRCRRARSSRPAAEGGLLHWRGARPGTPSTPAGGLPAEDDTVARRRGPRRRRRPPRPCRRPRARAAPGMGGPSRPLRSRAGRCGRRPVASMRTSTSPGLGRVDADLLERDHAARAEDYDPWSAM